MKAILWKNGSIQNIEINEACSSGCGSFIDGFANMLGMSVSDFALMACHAQKPCDLGTRCICFHEHLKSNNHFVKELPLKMLQQGLSYSVIKNCLFKVLKLKNPE
jgi:activator of 2-hydroxyglutaryl-CoA dehydratase